MYDSPPSRGPEPGFGAHDREDPVGVLRERRPYLLPRRPPSSSPSRRARQATFARSEPAFGLRIALAPNHFCARHGRRRSRRFCSSVPCARAAGRHECLAVEGGSRWGAGAGVLHGVHEFLRHSCFLAAVFAGPAQAQPAAGGELGFRCMSQSQLSSSSGPPWCT